jgi:hypothetical protein
LRDAVHEDSALLAQPQVNALDAGMIFADLDADGDVGMLVNWEVHLSSGGDDYVRGRVLISDGNINLVEKTTDIGLRADHLAMVLYRNDLPAQSWLNVRPVGLAGNKSQGTRRFASTKPARAICSG